MDRRRAHHDWDEIRSFYEAGHSLAECRERFGFGGSSWDRAVKRGDIRPRRGGQGLVNDERRQAVVALVEEGLPRVDVARRLGVSISTVAYYARTLGLDIDERCARRYDWQEVQRYYDRGHGVRACIRHFGFSSETWHQAKLRGDIDTRPRVAPISTYLVKGRRVARGHLKRRLLAEGLKESRCEECGIARSGGGGRCRCSCTTSTATGTTTGWRTCSCCAGTAIARRRTSRGRTRGGRGCRRARSGSRTCRTGDCRFAASLPDGWRA